MPIKDKCIRHLPTMAVAAAIVVCSVSAHHLTSMASRVSDRSERLRLSDEANSSGSLTGWNFVEDREWPPPRDGSGRQFYERVVLFRIVSADDNREWSFWRDVSDRSKETMPDIQFVAVCGDTVACRQAVIDSAGAFTLLSAMDPLQMRSVEVSRQNDSAMLYHNHRFWQRLQMDMFPESAADSVVRAFWDAQERGSL